jgi:low affinity Fe/Cu permease
MELPRVILLFTSVGVQNQFRNTTRLQSSLNEITT